MTRNISQLIFFLFFFTFGLQAQFINCDDSEVEFLCDLNDIDGIIFTSPDPELVDVPTDSLCGDGGALHNPGWFSFIAGSVDIELNITPLSMTCDTTTGGLSGIQVVLWQGCPGTGGICVAGNSDCQDTVVTLNATDLIIGEIYNLLIDGCGGSICTVEIEINSATEYALTDLEDVELGEPKYNFQYECNNSLGEGNFCTDVPIYFAVDDNFYLTLGAEYTWTVSGPNIQEIEWDFGSFSGIGPPFVIGNLNGELGVNGINMLFPESGNYTVCLNNVSTYCDSEASGMACTTINIILPGDQNFGAYEVCSSDLMIGWDPTDYGIVSDNGIPWLSGPIFLDDVLNFSDGLLSIDTQDECGCEIEQIIQIDIVGTLEPETVELYIWECMLPYTWFGEEVTEFENLPQNLVLNLEEKSTLSGFDGGQCDSIVNLNVIPLSFQDTVIIGNGSEQEKEYTFRVLPPDSIKIQLMNPIIQWIDTTTNSIVSTDSTALLPIGTYYVNYIVTLPDLNFKEDSLAGIDSFVDCEILFGPYDLGTSSLVNEQSKYSDLITLYPNPFINTLNIKNESLEIIQEIYFIDALGRKTSLENQFDKTKLNLKDLTQGLNFIHIKLKNGQVVIKKLVKL